MEIRNMFCGVSHGHESGYNAGDLGSIPGLGRSPAEGNGYPLQYFGLESPMDRGAQPMGSQRAGVTNTFGNWRKGDPCFKVAKNMAESCSCFGVVWKVEFESNETGYLANETSKQSVEGVTWFFVTADRKL